MGYEAAKPTATGRMQGLQVRKFQLEIAQCAVGARQLPFGHVVGSRWQLDRACIINNAGHAQFVLHQSGHPYGLFGGTHNAAHAAGLDGFCRRHWCRQLGSGNQGGLLGVQPFGLRVGGTPAGAIPDINGLERR